MPDHLRELLPVAVSDLVYWGVRVGGNEDAPEHTEIIDAADELYDEVLAIIKASE